MTTSRGGGGGTVGRLDLVIVQVAVALPSGTNFLLRPLLPDRAAKRKVETPERERVCEHADHLCTRPRLARHGGCSLHGWECDLHDEVHLRQVRHAPCEAGQYYGFLREVGGAPVGRRRAGRGG
jgi:hypothetical protein